MVARPVMRYHGGKWELAKWIIPHFPPHKIYTEAYGGAASVLLRKSRSYAEVYNDLDGEIVNVFRVLRNPKQAKKLNTLIALTPYSRADYDESFIPTDDPIEQARRTLFRSASGWSGRGVLGEKTGFRIYSKQSRNATPANDWRNFAPHIQSFITRLQGVYIENRPALEIIQRHDADDALHYVDPPYVLSTRDSGRDYRHELTNDDHRELGEVLAKCKGFVIVSGYRCDLYDQLFDGWTRIDKKAFAEGALSRIESLWLNPKAAKMQLRMDVA